LPDPAKATDDICARSFNCNVIGYGHWHFQRTFDRRCILIAFEAVATGVGSVAVIATTIEQAAH